MADTPFSELGVDELRQWKRELVEALGTGALEVKHGDRETRFRSEREMRRTIEFIDRLIRQKTGRKKPVAGVATFNRGL